jgi:GxxExxY protein
VIRSADFADFADLEEDRYMQNEERDPRTYAIIGAAMEVHRQLGCGFLEAVYQEALELELAARSVPFNPQLSLAVTYKGQQLKCKYCADFLCFDEVIVEIKALAKLTGIEEAQIINYLKATGLETGLLINFGARSLEYRRFIRSRSATADENSNL